MYKVTITEVNSADDDAAEIARYEQIVDQLDMKAVIDAVNRVPPQPRRPRSDAGKPRRQDAEDFPVSLP